MKNIFKYGLFLAMPLFMACSEEGVDYVPAEQVPAGCPVVEFSADNQTILEVDPTIPYFTFTVTRKDASAAADYALNVLENEGDSFSVPASVSFASGATEATVRVDVNSGCKTAVPLRLTVALDDADINPYTQGFKSYTTDVTVIKWNSCGMGAYEDGFWFGFYDEVEIFERDDQPGTYRFKNPYTDERTIADGSDLGTNVRWQIFYLNPKNDLVTWDQKMYINVIHPSYGVELVGYLPSALSSSLAASDKLSHAVRNAAGEIMYFIITPYWYMDGVGGYGTNYPCYLIFPAGLDE